MMLKREIFFTILLLPFLYIISHELISNYVGGDQVHYRAFYHKLESASFMEVMPLAIRNVSSREPLSAYVLWFGSSVGVDKNVYISILNVLLLYGVLLLLNKYSVEKLPIFLMLTNFYVVVLLTGAERLKIAYILIVWAALLGKKAGFFLMSISPLAHLQMFIYFPSIFFAKYARNLKRISAGVSPLAAP